MLGDLTAEASFTRIEEDVRRFWRRHGVPEAFHAPRRGRPPYTFYQQPLMAAGQRKADQVRLMSTADALARYRAMRGDAVHRWTAWAGHGLPVEVAVEQRVGSGMAGYDLEQFNAACRQAALEGMQQLETLAERLGVWLRPDDTHATLTPQAIGATWGAMRKLWDAGRLKHERRIASVCPRCATPLSTAEAAQLAAEVEVQEIWVQMPWDGEPSAYFLAWPPVPWKLVGMVALAVHPEMAYVLVEVPARAGAPPTRLLLAESSLRRTLTADYKLVRRLPGRSLRGARYHPPFTFLPAGEGAHRVVLSEEVPLDLGTGLLPVTPAFDALSLALAQRHRLLVPELLDDWGSLDDTVMPWRGLMPMDAEPLLVEDLQTRGLVFRQQVGTRQISLCPYCQSSLIPQARDVWLVETAGGPWIVGRDRAWGGPLPVWACEACGQQVCVGGLDELAHRTGIEVGHIEPHRPAIDRLTFPCESCSETMRRVPVVVDAAFEAAVLPWSTAPPSGPANLAVGLGDRHLGWLGDLTEMAAQLRGSLAWQQAVAVPESEAEDTWDLERMPPADMVRWAVYTGISSDQAEREFLRPLWRLVVASLAGPPSDGQEEPEVNELLDRWLMARLYQATRTVSEALEASDVRAGAETLASLVADLGQWYAPFRPGAGGHALRVLSLLLAPFAPYLAEAIHREVDARQERSVHLVAWPRPDPAWADSALLANMARVWNVAALGQAARTRAGVPSEEQLPRALVGVQPASTAGEAALVPFQRLLARVLGVAQVEFGPQAAQRVSWRLSLDPDRTLERELAVDQLEAALAALETEPAANLAAQLWAGLSVSLEVAGRAITLLPDQVHIMADAQPGWAAAADVDQLVLLEVA